MRLLIVVPCGDTVRYEFAESLAKLCIQLGEDGVDFDVKFHEGSLVYAAREELAIAAIDEHFTHVLWLDSDIQFTRDLFNILYRVGKPFVTGIYRSRRYPYAPALFSSVATAQRVLKWPNVPFQVEACGFGCVLTDVEVLMEVRRHYGTCFTPTPEHGEDIAMCKRYRDIGGEVWATPDACVNHMTYVPLRTGDCAKLCEYKEQI